MTNHDLEPLQRLAERFAANELEPGLLARVVADAELVADRVPHLHYLPGDKLLIGRENGTVDGVHPTDLGFFRLATAYEPVLSAILAGQP